MARIAWLIPRLVHGSGGIRTMLQHAHGLERAGHDCHLYIEGVGSDARARKQVRKLFGYAFSNVGYGWDAIAPADVVIATIWYSAAIVRDLPFASRKMYFVQDYEAWFNSLGDTYLLAQNSYLTGLTPITIGRWLRYELGKRFALPAFHFDFGADLSVYRPLPDARRELAVCFLHQPEKPRRCTHIGLDALGIVKYLMPEVRIYLYGSREKSRTWFEHEHLGLLTVDDCNALYNRCAAGLSLSASNPSRVPFEMMAAGLAVVELWRETTLHDFPPRAVLLGDPSPEAIAEALLQVLEDPSRRQRMGDAGVRFMSQRGAANEIEQFVHSTERVLAGEAPEFAGDDAPLYTAPPVHATERCRTLPTPIRTRLNAPPNAYVNSLPPPLRSLIGVAARFGRSMLERR